MKSFAFLSLLFLVSGQARAENQFPPNRLAMLNCVANNDYGVSHINLEGEEVILNLKKVGRSYDRIDSLGTSPASGIGYLSFRNANDYTTILFPGQALTQGGQVLTGSLYLDTQAMNPMFSELDFGAPWASVTCEVTIL